MTGAHLDDRGACRRRSCSATVIRRNPPPQKPAYLNRTPRTRRPKSPVNHLVRRGDRVLRPEDGRRRGLCFGRPNHLVEVWSMSTFMNRPEEKFLPITAVTFCVSKVHMNKPHGS